MPLDPKNWEMKVAKLVTTCDRISSLPEDLLLQILSLIPVRNAMSTSLLSKRWKSLWKTMPTLVFDENSSHNIGGFDQFCCMSLPLLHEAHVLKTLVLILKNHSDSIDTLLFPNIPSTLLEITITLNSCPPLSYSSICLPLNLQVFKTLVVLKLQDRILLDVVHSPVCFPSLKFLHLLRVNFSRQESLCKMLLACPVLEHLFIQRLSSVGRFLFSISVPSLKRLSITRENAYYHGDDPSFEINTPSLIYLEIKDRRSCFDFVESMPKLVEANVSVHESKTGKLLKFLTSLEHLSLYLYPSMDSHLTDTLTSNRLLHLELHIYNQIELDLLIHLLEVSPKLRALKFNQRHWFQTGDTKFKPSSVPECLRFHLETLEWIGYGGTVGEKETADYILENAHRLKTATISTFNGLRESYDGN